MTLLQIVNRVLRRLREDEVTDFTDPYTVLLLEFVADVHNEVLAAYDWSTFDHDENVTLVAAQAEYPLLGTTTQSLLRYAEGRPLVYWYEDSTAGDGQPLTEISWDAYVANYQLRRDETQTQPCYFALRFNGDNMVMAVWPTPETSGGYIRCRFNTPEAAVDPETATPDDEVLVPERPLYLGALYLALNERGEEMGEPGSIAETRYYHALAEAKEVDLMKNGRVNKLEFYRD